LKNLKEPAEGFMKELEKNQRDKLNTKECVSVVGEVPI
jgi:hypothetical protein